MGQYLYLEPFSKSTPQINLPLRGVPRISAGRGGGSISIFFVRNSSETDLMGMARNTIFPYNPALRKFARELRNNSTFGEILLWQQIKGRKLGVQFHRQVPILNYITDFYCHEIFLAIEVDRSIHGTKEQREKDQKKDYELNQLGIQVLRIDDRDVKKNMDSVIRYIQYWVDKQEMKRL